MPPFSPPGKAGRGVSLSDQGWVKGTGWTIESGPHTYKIGDIVEVVAVCGFDIGTVGEVIRIHNSGSLDVSANGLTLYHNPESLTIASYKKAQAFWIKKHKIKEGDKVKIVKGYKNGEDGFNLPTTDDTTNNREKKALIGIIVKIGFVNTNYINIKDSSSGIWVFPYFCLEPI